MGHALADDFVAKYAASKSICARASYPCELELGRMRRGMRVASAAILLSGGTRGALRDMSG
eukprot:scaffold7420_cov28-Tisochrysis_lutea.AAC.5